MTSPNQDQALGSLLSAVKQACCEEVWTKAVNLTRRAEVSIVSQSTAEVVLKVTEPGRAVGTKVILYLDDCDWSCDSASEEDPSEYVAAAIIALKSGVGLAAAPANGRPENQEYIKYDLRTESAGLALDRILVTPRGNIEIGGSLIEFAGGAGSGRISGVKYRPLQEDFAVDAALGSQRRPIIAADAMDPLLRALSRVEHVELDGEPIEVSTARLLPVTEIIEEGDGFRLRSFYPPEVTKVFANGAALCAGVLHAAPGLAVSPAVSKLLAGKGTYFSREYLGELCSEVLPMVSREVDLVVRTAALPEVREMPLAIEFDTEVEGETLAITARMYYGKPPDAEVCGDSIRFFSAKPPVVPVRSRGQERSLLLSLQQHHLQLGRTVRYEGAEAVWKLRELPPDWTVNGDAAQVFARQGALFPQVSLAGGLVSLDFIAPPADAVAAGGKRPAASAGRVLDAWERGEELVPLLGGGWAEVPRDWLNSHGARIKELLRAQQDAGKLSPALNAVAVEVVEELNGDIAEADLRLRTALKEVDELTEPQLPEDLAVELREYQKFGVSWLLRRKQFGLGAILADDMGLGKTLQAICCMTERCLVVAPTSVIHSWAEQIARFRPSLTVNVYHRSKRELQQQAQVTITSYAVLRMEYAALSEQPWDMVVLDESQTIKNPDSQTARAAFKLRASFRLALSGTPVENRLDDLWSQFQFINPGLLGTREYFRDTIARGAARGEEEARRELRRRVQPLILRRLKTEVARELPEKIETVLYAELDAEEQKTYESVYLATRKEVIEKLNQGEGTFAALEALLRVRQACCHQGLLPGREHVRHLPSSKVSLLLEELEKSISNGHRALVFSQWTSFLDIIEPHLEREGIRFLRLDGATRDREGVVRKFQSDGEIPLMLISLKAGGLGLTLTAADHIYLMDSWWNPAVEKQAADRAHRIGQTKAVLVQRIIVRNSIEERILELQERKKDLAEAVLARTGEPGFDPAALEQSVLTKDDLLSLVA